MTIKVYMHHEEKQKERKIMWMMGGVTLAEAHQEHSFVPSWPTPETPQADCALDLSSHQSDARLQQVVVKCHI